MRKSWLGLALLAGVAVAGCGSDDAQHGGAMDMAIPDLAHATGDLANGGVCNPHDPMTDGTACNQPGGCPSGTIGVNIGNSCKCLFSCNGQADCSCNRFCDPLTRNDASAGAACIPGNSAGERCDNGFLNNICNQLTVCVNADQARAFRYCNYRCTSQTDCPAQTTCQPLYDAQGNPDGLVCAYTAGTNGNKNPGDACSMGDVCKGGTLCSGVGGTPGTCVPQCDGPGATCATGTCTELDDPANNKVIGYICK